MTYQEICLIRVLLGFALILAGLFPLCVVIFGLHATLWVWGIGYAGCLVGTFLLSRRSPPDGHSLRGNADPEFETQAIMLSKRLSLDCPHIARADIDFLVRSVLEQCQTPMPSASSSVLGRSSASQARPDLH